MIRAGSRSIWALLILSLELTGLSGDVRGQTNPATNPAGLGGKNENTDDKDDNTSKSTVTLADEIARGTREIERYEVRLAQLRQLRYTLASVQETTGKSDVSASANVQAAFDGLKREIREREASQQTPANLPGTNKAVGLDGLPRAARLVRRLGSLASSSAPLASIAPTQMVAVGNPASYSWQIRSVLSYLVQTREYAAQLVSHQIVSLRNAIASLAGTAGSADAQPANFPFQSPSTFVVAAPPVSYDPGKINVYFPMTAHLLAQVDSGDPQKKIDPQAISDAESELKNIGTILATIDVKNLNLSVTSIGAELEKAISDVEQQRDSLVKTVREKTRQLRNRDDYISQSQINSKLVWAVYLMIVSIVVLFLILRFLPPPLANSVVEQRVLIEVLSMGFLLLTVIILGTGKLLNTEGLAALLGTIAGYLFARKAAEMAAAGETPRIVRPAASTGAPASPQAPNGTVDAGVAPEVHDGVPPAGSTAGPRPPRARTTSPRGSGPNAVHASPPPSGQPDSPENKPPRA
jgi:hypothetical protein